MKKHKITQQYEQEKHTENIAELMKQLQIFQNENARLKIEISILKGQLDTEKANKSTPSCAPEFLNQPAAHSWLFSSIKGFITEQKTSTATAAVNEQWRYYQYLLNHMYEEQIDFLTYEKTMMVKNAAGGGDVKGTQREWDKAVKVLNKALSYEYLTPPQLYKNRSNQILTQKRLINIVSDSLRSKINQVYFCKPCYESLKTPMNCLHVIAQGCVSHFKNTNNKVIKKIHNDHGLTMDIILEADFDYHAWVYQLNLPCVIEFSCNCNIEKGDWSIEPIERNADYEDFDVRTRWIENPQKNQSTNLDSRRGEKRSRGRPPLAPSQKFTQDISTNLSSSSSSLSLRAGTNHMVDDSDSDDDEDIPGTSYAPASPSNMMWNSLGTVAAMVTGSIKRGRSEPSIRGKSNGSGGRSK